MTITTGTMLDHALAYATRGWPVFPIIPQAKKPATKHSFYNASGNPATIERWFGSGFPYNVAIRTGAASGMWVLDIDPRHGGDKSLFDLEAIHGPLPATLQAITGSGGTHYYFRYVGPIQSVADRVAKGIDIKGDGGYVVAPPSKHPNGTPYRWANNLPPAIAPAWLVELTRKKLLVVPISERALANVRRTHTGNRAYGLAALEDEIEILANTPRGHRNDQLNRSTFALFQLVGGGELDEPDVLPRLIHAAHINGLMTDKDDGLGSVLKTIASARAAGLANPRSRPGAA